MTETWYVLEDGSLGDPAMIGHDDNGVLRHEDGRAVSYGPHGPKSRGGVDGEKERAKVAKKDVKPEEPKRGYKTRESKAD